MAKQVKRMRKREKIDANFTKGPWGLQEIMASSGGLRALWHMALIRHAAHTHTHTRAHAPAHNVSVRGTSPRGPGESLHTRQRLWAKDGRCSVMKSNQYCANDSDEMLLHIESVEAMFALHNSGLLGCPRLHAWSYCFKKRNYFCLLSSNQANHSYDRMLFSIIKGWFFNFRNSLKSFQLFILFI